MNGEVTIAPEPPNAPGVPALIAALDALQESLYPAQSNHLVPIEALMAPGVTFLVARCDGEAVGCAAFVAHRDYAEIKRMFVAPTGRGSGLGRRLLTAVEASVAAAGLACMRLETGIHQAEAIALYESAGFEFREPFGDYVEDPLSLFMEKNRFG